MAATEFVPNQAKTEGITAHVIWLGPSETLDLSKLG